MLVFLQPIWLWAMAALAVPIALHLLSRGPGPRVLVGSVRLLERTASRRARRISINRPWLLLLRCLLLLSVIVALAQPVWQARLNPDPLVLVDPELLSRRSELEMANAEAYGDLDRLIGGNADALRLQPGLPKLGSPASQFDEARLWSLVAEAARTRKEDAEIHVFVVDRLEKLQGIRPPIAQDIQLRTIPEPGTRSWVERETLDADGTVLVGNSSAAGSFLREIQKDKVGSELPARSSPRALRASIRHDDDREIDASYVAAAMSAAAEILGRHLELEVADSGVALGPEVAVLFYLSAERFHGEQGSLRILVEDRGSEPAQTSYTTFFARREIWQRPAHLLKDFQGDSRPPLGSSAAVWIDDQGRSVLEESSKEGLRQLFFHGRFHPEWTDLVERAAFPRWIAGLLRPTEARSFDLRQAGESQWLPSISKMASEPVRPTSPPNWIWVAVALLFLSERFASARIDVD